MAMPRTPTLRAHPSWVVVQLLLVAAIGAPLTSCGTPSFYRDTVAVARRREPLAQQLSTLSFSDRVPAFEAALARLGTTPVEPVRERTLTVDTIVALESMDVVAGAEYLVIALADEPADVRLVIVGAHGQSIAHDVGLGPDAWARFRAERTERVRIRLFAATGAGRVALLRHRTGELDVDPALATRAPRALGLQDELGRLDAEMRARGYLPVDPPSVGVGTFSPHVTVPPGQCYPFIVATEDPEVRVRGSRLRGGEPRAGTLCSESLEPMELAIEARASATTAVGVYRRAVSIRYPTCADRCYARDAGEYGPAMDDAALLHQEGYEPVQAIAISGDERADGDVITLRGGQCYALTARGHLELQPPDAAVPARVAIDASDASRRFWTHCPERDERARAVLRWRQRQGRRGGTVQVFQRRSEPLDALIADVPAASSTPAPPWAEASLLALEGYVDVPLPEWSSQGLRAELSLDGSACYALLADTDARVEGSARLGPWAVSAAAAGPFALRFCPPRAGRYTVELRASATELRASATELRASAALPSAPGARLLHRAGHRTCALDGPRPRHAVPPAWIGREASPRAQHRRARSFVAGCLETARSLQSSFRSYSRAFAPLQGRASSSGLRRPSALARCLEEARRATDEWPPLVELEKAALRTALTGQALEPLVDELDRYYAQERYLEDGMTRGRELHPLLVGLYEAGACAAEDLSRDYDALLMAARRELLDELVEGQQVDAALRQRVRVLSGELAALGYGLYAGDPAATRAAYEAKLRALEIAVNSLLAHRSGGDCTSNPTVQRAAQPIMAAALRLGRADGRDRAAMGAAVEAIDEAIRGYEDALGYCRRLEP